MGKKIEHLYAHIPFCAHICPYCGFYKHKISSPLLKPFIAALRHELDHVRKNFDLLPKTIYFGGGTPSALSLFLLQKFFRNWPWREIKEFTFECNPATLSLDKIKFLREMGVNRISLGIQSFDHHSLRWLGRTHTREQIQETLKRLRQCGFENVNFDLMFGLPGQTLPQWRQTLTEALSLNPQHISAYNLNFEEGTEFLKKLQNGAWKMNEALEKEMFMYAHEFLEKHCFEHYEISNFAPKKWQSVHNLAYWEGENYLGIGPSACSTIDDVRLQNISDTLSYITSVQKSGAPQCSKEPLSSQTKLLEKIFLGLRTKNGIAMKEILPWQNQAADLIQNNLAKIENDRLKLTLNGFLVADEISEIFA